MSTATQSLRPLMDRVRRSWRTSPLPKFLAWWGGELRALLPLRWRGWFSGGAVWHLLQHDGCQWVLRRDGQHEALARWGDGMDSAEYRDSETPVSLLALDAALRQVDPEDRRLALLLPTDVVLRRTLMLPLAARDNLRQVVAFEMDRQTPFAVAQVYYAARELSAATDGRFQAELVASTRITLDPLLANLRAQGIAVDAVDVAVADTRLGINLLPDEQIPHRIRPRRRLNLLLTAACALLLVLVMGDWVHNREVTLHHMQAEVDSMQNDAQQVARLRQQLQDNAGAAGFLAQRKKNTVGMLSLLQDVTMRLPDSTWLERFSVDNTGQIGMQGQSKQAAKLLDALQNSKLLTNASFQGSIQPDPSTGKERFYLVAQVNQPVAAKSKSATGASNGSGGAR